MKVLEKGDNKVGNLRVLLSSIQLSSMLNESPCGSDKSGKLRCFFADAKINKKKIIFQYNYIKLEKDIHFFLYVDAKTNPLKNTIPSFFASPPIYWSLVNSPLNSDISENPIILKFFVLNAIPSSKSN